MATVLVVGSGGREMAQAMTLAKSPLVAKVIVAPGNGGNASCSPKISNVAIKVSPPFPRSPTPSSQGKGHRFTARVSCAALS